MREKPPEFRARTVGMSAACIPGMDQETVLSWMLFGSCGEVRCEARRCGEGFQFSLLNEGVLLSAEWVPDVQSLLQRTGEVRQKLKDHGFDHQPSRSPVLLGGPSWGPDRPSTALVGCLR